MIVSAQSVSYTRLAHSLGAMRMRFRLLLSLVSMSILLPTLAQTPPPILQITVERVKPGAEADYGRIEERLKDVCIKMSCPNAYLALESVEGPKEVWWLVMYGSEDDVERVAAEYAANEQLLKEMSALNALKKNITYAPISHMTTRQGAPWPWRIGAELFAVIAPVEDFSHPGVFESKDGARFAIVSAATRAAADAEAAALGTAARVFATRPEWSKPDDAWVDANPQLWSQ